MYRGMRGVRVNSVSRRECIGSIRGSRQLIDEPRGEIIAGADAREPLGPREPIGGSIKTFEFAQCRSARRRATDLSRSAVGLEFLLPRVRSDEARRARRERVEELRLEIG